MPDAIFARQGALYDPQDLIGQSLQSLLLELADESDFDGCHRPGVESEQFPTSGCPTGRGVSMYGTIAKMTLKPGSFEKMQSTMDDGPETRPGHVATYIFKSDADANVHFVVTVFEDKAAYRKLADDPEQDKRFKKMRELLAADPEWHDGEVVHSDVKVKAAH